MKSQLPPITGILLAGGKSSRMGQDKGMIRAGKLLMYQYPLRVLESLCNEILISTCNPMQIEESYEQVCDEIPGIGPIGGILTCLKRSSNDLNIVLSYDIPLVNKELFLELLSHATDQSTTLPDNTPLYDAVLPAGISGKPEPLCGIYRKNSANVFQEMIGQGVYAIHKIIPRTDSFIVRINPAMPFFHEQLFININSKADLSDLESYLNSGS
jgi:molybdopterin-guanine dinucleotide biosynthesis protein A